MTTELDGAIKRGAQGLGAWMIRGDEFAACGWSYASAESLLGLTLSGPRPAPDQFRIVSFDGGRWDVDALAAAVHVLLLETGRTIERPCPDCAERRGGWEWDRRMTIGDAIKESVIDREYFGSRGWEIVQEGGRFDVTIRTRASRPCPACAVDGKPTGRVHVEAARVLLESTKWTPADLGGYGCEFEDCSRKAMMYVSPAGPGFCPIHMSDTSRADLEVLADALMSPLPRGAAQEPAEQTQARNALGQVLALWLAGELREGQVLGVETMTDLVTWTLRLS